MRVSSEALNSPFFAIVFVQVLVGLGEVCDSEFGGVPIQGLVGEINCEVSELCGFGQRAGVVEVGFCLAFAETCIYPLLVVVYGSYFGAFVGFEFFERV